MSLIPNYCSCCCERYFYEPGIHDDRLCFKCISKIRSDFPAEIGQLESELWECEQLNNELEEMNEEINTTLICRNEELAKLEKELEEMTKKKNTTATANKPKKPRKPRLATEDYGILKHALEALTREEERREIVFAERHITTEDGKDFTGTYAELCALYQSYGRPTGTVMRSKAQALLEKIAPHASK